MEQYKEKVDPLYQIVSKFPEVIEYRNELENVENDRRYLMLVGGSVTERDACIDYISRLPFSGVNVVSCLHNSKDDLKGNKVHLIGCKNSLPVSALLATKEEPANNTIYNSRLFVLNNIAYVDNQILDEFSDKEYKPNFLIATTGDRGDLWGLPQMLRNMFKEVDISTKKVNLKLAKKIYAPRDEVDDILEKFIMQYPKATRPFIVKKAMPDLKDAFPGKAMYNKGTLMTRISIIRYKSKDPLS